MTHGKRASQNRGMYPPPQKKNLRRMCQIIKCPPLWSPRNLICVRLAIANLFPKYYTQSKGWSFWPSPLRILPLKSFCRSEKPKSKPVVSKILRMGKSSNTVSFVFSVSGRWARPWFHTLIGPLYDERILLLLQLLLLESLRVLLSWTNEGFIFQTSHNLRSGPQNKMGRRTASLQVKLFAKIS